MTEIGTADNIATFPAPFDQTGVGEKPQMMRQGGGGHPGAFPYITDRQAFVACFHQRKHDLEPGFRADGRKSPSGVFRCDVFYFHKTGFIVSI